MWFRSVFVALTVLAGAAYGSPYTRIVNGTDSDITKYPFVVSLRVLSGQPFCGGSIIGPKWILTAGHCVESTLPEDINVQYGVTKISPDGNVVDVKDIYIHEGFDLIGNIPDDIALLELSEELVFDGKTVDAVKLPPSNFELPQEREGVPGVVIGWGHKFSGGEMQEHLLEATVKIYSDKECRVRHLGLTTEHQLCGGLDDGGRGHCKGDSGGPLLYQGNMQVGVVSWSVKPCGSLPGVFTKVSHYIDWINQYIQ